MGKRTFWRLCAAVMIAVLLGTVVFLAGTADHDCTGEHCVLCGLAGELSRLLGQGYAGAVGLVWAALLLHPGIRQGSLRAAAGAGLSLVGLKVKLSN